MLTSLLATKLLIPRPRPTLVERRRLLEPLRSGFGRPVTLISAPAGYGKTTLAAEWAAASGWPTVWLTLDEGDNDLARFLAYLVAGLQKVEAALGQATAAALQTRPLPPVAVLLPPLLNDLNALPRDVLLVLDDYHQVEANTIHEAVTFLIDHQPPPLHLILVTRADPPLPIARLRGRGQLTELRQADLGFTLDEAASLLRQAMGQDLPESQVVALWARTEGWATGLHLAAASLRGRDLADVDAFVRAFSGTHRHVLDYLVEEVLQRQPAEVQAFLLRTSILSRLCGPLCDAVLDEDEPATPRPPSSALLHQLEHANLFLVPLDDHHEWYRYHPLFAEILEYRLRQAHPEHVRGLHLRAAAWHEAHGLMAEAIGHASAAGEAERAADLIERAVPDAWRQGEIALAASWLKALPEPVITTRPRLCLYDAIWRIFAGSALAEASARVERAAQLDTGGLVRGEVLTLRSVIALVQGDLEQCRELAEAALQFQLEPEWFRGLAVRVITSMALYTGDAAPVIARLEADVETCRQGGDRLGASASLRRLGSVHVYQGRLYQARTYYQRALELSVDAQGHPWPMAGRILVHLAELAVEWNELEAGLDYATDSLALLSDLAPALQVPGYLVLARLRRALGDRAGMEHALAQAWQAARETETPLDDAQVAITEATLWLQQGDPQPAARWAAARQEPPDRRSTGVGDLESRLATVFIHEMEQMMLARLDLANGQPQQSQARLAPLLETAGRQKRLGSLIQLHVLQARALLALGQTAEARVAVEAALSLAEPEGFVRVFLDEGEPLHDLLAQVSPTCPYARRLLEAFESGAPRSHSDSAFAMSPPPPNSPLVEPLSQRELDVLGLIADGLSNQQIAEKLFLSIYTIKFHTYNLYGKLGVHTRTQAVARARSLGLLTSA